MPRTHKQFPVLPLSLENEDPCTLVSIVPFIINEFKPGIYPGRFVIPPCMDDNTPEFLKIGASVHFVSQFNGDDELPAIVIKTTAREMAVAVVSDYMQAQMDVTEDCRPGLIWIPGAQEEISAAEHKGMKQKQLRWFGKLVQRADNDWNRYKNNKVISDNQRFAARALGYERDWLNPSIEEVPVKCPSCFTNVDPRAVVCANCRFVLDKKRHEEMTFAA
jgi:hypothetical protein